MKRGDNCASARDTFGVYGDTKAESIKTLYTTLITIHVRAFPSTDHSNCVDMSKCYLANQGRTEGGFVTKETRKIASKI